MKKIIFWAIIAILLSWSNYNILLKLTTYEPHTGIILHDYRKEHINKSQYYCDYYFSVDFGNEIREIKVNRRTWANFGIGEKITFNNFSDWEWNYEIQKLTIGFIFSVLQIILFSLSLVALIVVIFYLIITGYEKYIEQ